MKRKRANAGRARKGLQQKFSEIIASSNVVAVSRKTSAEYWLIKVPDYQYFRQYGVFNELCDEYAEYIGDTESRFEFLARRECLAARIHQRICGENSVPTLRHGTIRHEGKRKYAIASKFIASYTDWANLDLAEKKNSLRGLIAAGLASVVVGDVDFHPGNIGVDRFGAVIKIEFGSCLDEGIIDPIEDINATLLNNIFSIQGLFRGFENLDILMTKRDYDAMISDVLLLILELEVGQIREDIHGVFGNRFVDVAQLLEKALISNIEKLKRSIRNYFSNIENRNTVQTECDQNHESLIDQKGARFSFIASSMKKCKVESEEFVSKVISL